MQIEATPLNLKITRCGAVAIKAIQESKTNPRQNFDGIDELAASIKRDGVLSPVLVRKRGTGEAFELVFGARRLRAAKVVGLEEIPANVIECSDEEAQEIQIVENCQRADVHPMEEAVAIERLRATIKGADPVGQVAARIGKSRAHVLKRIQLLNLPELARKAYLAGTIPYETAVMVARIADKDTRIEAAKLVLKGDWDGPLAPKEAKERIEHELLLRLGSATFDQKDATLLPDAGACGPCPKRSGNNQDLFGDVKGNDLCTDPGCFRKKLDADWARRAAAAGEKGIEVLTDEAAKKVFRNGNYVDSSSGFVDPNKEEYLGDKYTTYKKVLGKKAPQTVLVRDSSGRAVELYRHRDVQEILKKKAPKTAAKALKQATQHKDDERRRRKKDQANKEIRNRCIIGIVEAVEKGITEAKFLRLMLDLDLGNARQWRLQFMLKRRGIKTFKPLLEEKNANKIRGILVEQAIGDPGVSWHSEKRVPEIAKELGVNVESIKTEVAAAMKPKRKA